MTGDPLLVFVEATIGLAIVVLLMGAAAALVLAGWLDDRDGDGER